MPVGGPRQYSGPVQPVGSWICPACGEENAGKLGDGCVHCGAGKPGKRIEETVQPPAVPTTRNAVAAFEAWLQEWYPDASVDLRDVAWQAFQAGARYMLTQAEPTPAAVPELLPGTIETRTIIAALSFFAEQILTLSPEEVKTGEWLDKQGTLALITRLETPRA